jgi:hypothetical protein
MPTKRMQQDDLFTRLRATRIHDSEECHAKRKAGKVAARDHVAKLPIAIFSCVHGPDSSGSIMTTSQTQQIEDAIRQLVHGFTVPAKHPKTWVIEMAAKKLGVSVKVVSAVYNEWNWAK